MNQQSTFTRCILTMILAVSVGLPACTTVETQSFRASQSGNFEAAHIATDADFGKYESLYIKEMGIFFPQNSASTDKDMRRIREIFRGAFIAALQGYKIVQQAGPSTMTVQASLIDLRDASGNQISGIRKELRDMAAPGSLVFLMEMRDSESEAVLARKADSGEVPAFETDAGVHTDWSSVTEAAEHWAAMFRRFLDQNLSI